MASYIANDTDLTLIADAIRSKGKTTDSLVFPNEFVNAIAAISTSGTYNLQSKVITPSTSSQTVLPDSNYDALSSVTIESIPSEYIIPEGSISITANGTDINVSQYASVNVAVEGGPDIPVFTSDEEATYVTCNKTYAECVALINNNDNRAFLNAGSIQGVLAGMVKDESTVSYYYTYNRVPNVRIDYASDETLTLNYLNFERELIVSANGTYEPDDDYLWGSVSVNVPSGEPTLQMKTVTPTESQQTITPDTGYDGLSSVTVGAVSSTYVGSSITQRTSSDLTVSGATITAPAGYYASAATKSVTSTTQATPTISVNSSGLITATVTQSAGYVTAGTKSTTSQLSTQAGKTVTPSQSAQTAVASGKYTTGTITIAAIPSEYHDTSSGNITASDVVSGKIGFNASGSVTGTLTFQTIYSGSSNPSSSMGSNGDIYIKVVS